MIPRIVTDVLWSLPHNTTNSPQHMIQNIRTTHSLNHQILSRNHTSRPNTHQHRFKKTLHTTLSSATSLTTPSPPIHSALHTIEVIRGNQQLQAQLRRDIHIRHVLALGVLLVVIQVFADLF